MKLHTDAVQAVEMLRLTEVRVPSQQDRFPGVALEQAVTNLKCNLERGDSGVKLRWVSYIRGIVVVDC